MADSLLGALGCGRWLVQMIIDGLESESPYRYVICQATDGSIHRRMGFVRVGCVTRTKRAKEVEPAAPEASSADHSATGKRKRSTGGKAEATAVVADAAEGGDVLSRCIDHVCEAGDTCASVAKMYGVEAFDVLFLNRRKFSPKLHVDAELKKGTRLLVPHPLSPDEVRTEERAAHQSWHELSEETTLKSVSTKLGIGARELLELNKSSIKGLQLSSILMRGTRLQTGGIDADVDEYCHWTFPDDDQASGCPSYMMARRLKPMSERKPLCPLAETSASTARSSSARVRCSSPGAPIASEADATSTNAWSPQRQPRLQAAR